MTGASPGVQVNGQAAFFVGLFRKESRDMIMEVGILRVSAPWSWLTKALLLPTCHPAVGPAAQ